jgi:hypothetical protein
LCITPEAVDAVTTLGTGVDGTVRAQTLSFDTGGRPYQLTSYSSASSFTSGNTVNQVQDAYNGLSQLTQEWQSHSGVVVSTGGSQSPSVQYSYTLMASGVNNSRLTSKTYPNSRVVTYDYGTSGGLDDTISRVVNLKDGSTTDASYSFMGLDTMVRKNYPTPQDELDLWGGTTGTYTGLDQFQRDIAHNWVNTSTSASVFDANHGYDQDSNRLYADDQVYLGSSQSYAYDNLNRLTSFSRGAGTASGGTLTVSSAWDRKDQNWGLDALGNQLSQDTPSGGSAFFTNTPNSVNEYTSRTALGNSNNRAVVADGSFTGDSSSNWTKIGTSDAFNVNTSNSGCLTVTAVSQDTVDGYLEPTAQAIILRGGNIGPMQAYTRFTYPSTTTSGQIGFVFGYKSGADYWLWVGDIATNDTVLYHVVNGTRTSVASNYFGQVHYYGCPLYMSCRRGMFQYELQYATAISGGFPSGRWGVYTTVANTVFTSYQSWDEAQSRDMAGRWTNWSSSYPGTGSIVNNLINASTSQLTFDGINPSQVTPTLIKNLRLQKFQATFSMARTVTSETPASVNFLFNAGDQDSYDMIDIPHYTSSSYVWPIYGYKVVNGGTETLVSSTFTSSNCPTLTSTSTLWVQVQFDGTTLTIKELAGTSAPTTSAWSAAGVCYSSTSYPNTGGLTGFKAHDTYGSADIAISQVTVNSYDTGTSAFDIIEHFDNFSVNSSTGVATNTLASDNNGNQTFDGSNVYTYDAWNRMVSVSHGYRDASNNLQHGHVFETITYDAKGRRVTKAINGTGQWDCTYNYYLDKDSVVEERNGSNLTIKQYLWGLTYIDELVQTSLNSSPTTQSTCDTPYWAMQDSNFNNLGVVNSSGVLTERYEYTPYGNRVVYFASGSNDVGDFAPSVASQRFVVSSTGQAWGICPIGHQGLMHDEEAACCILGGVISMLVLGGGCKRILAKTAHLFRRGIPTMMP